MRSEHEANLALAMAPRLASASAWTHRSTCDVRYLAWAPKSRIGRICSAVWAWL